MMMLICIKHHLFMKKLRNTEAELKKALLIKKACILSSVLTLSPQSLRSNLEKLYYLYFYTYHCDSEIIRENKD